MELDYWLSPGSWQLRLELPDGTAHVVPFTVTPEDVLEPILVRVPH